MIDRHVADRRRFARILGTDGEHGSGLPIGTPSRGTVEEESDDRDAD